MVAASALPEAAKCRHDGGTPRAAYQGQWMSAIQMEDV